MKNAPPPTTEYLIIVACLAIAGAVLTIAREVLVPLVALVLYLAGWRPGPAAPDRLPWVQYAGRLQRTDADCVVTDHVNTVADLATARACRDLSADVGYMLALRPAAQLAALRPIPAGPHGADLFRAMGMTPAIPEQMSGRPPMHVVMRPGELPTTIIPMNDLQNLSYPVLRSMARAAGLPATGTAQQLRERLARHTAEEAAIDRPNNSGPEALTAEQRNAGGLL